MMMGMGKKEAGTRTEDFRLGILVVYFAISIMQGITVLQKGITATSLCHMLSIRRSP